VSNPLFPGFLTSLLSQFLYVPLLRLLDFRPPTELFVPLGVFSLPPGFLHGYDPHALVRFFLSYSWVNVDGLLRRAAGRSFSSFLDADMLFRIYAREFSGRIFFIFCVAFTSPALIFL